MGVTERTEPAHPAALERRNSSSAPSSHDADSSACQGAVDEDAKVRTPAHTSEDDSDTDSEKTKASCKTRKQRIISNFQFAAVSFCMATVGWNDASNGPLIPRLREVYSLGYTVVSLIFVAQCLGSLTGALINVWITNKIGFGKVLILGCCLQITAYSVQASAPPFPAFICFGFINGIGISLQVAHGVGFIGALSTQSKTKMNLSQAFYGFGALCAPLVATQFSQMRRWSFHYLVSLGLALVNMLSLSLIFRFRGQRECLLEAGEHVEPLASKAQEKGKLKQIIANPNTHYLAFFLLTYVGVEVTMGGWIVTYIIEVRNGGPSSGYISSGFFGGLCLGRVILIPVNKMVGERRMQLIYGILSIAMDLIIWFVPSLIGNAIAAAFMGLFLAPMYPIAMNTCSKLMPPNILTGAIGWIGAFGQAGSAISPFIAGAIAQNHGMKSLHPFELAMMVAMLILYFMTPADAVAKSVEAGSQPQDAAYDEKEKQAA